MKGVLPWQQTFTLNRPTLYGNSKSGVYGKEVQVGAQGAKETKTGQSKKSRGKKCSQAGGRT